MSNVTQLVDYINRNIFPKVNVSDLDENMELIYHLNDSSRLDDPKNVIYYCVQGIAQRENADQSLDASIKACLQSISEIRETCATLNDATQSLNGVSQTDSKIYMVGSALSIGNSSVYCNPKCYEYNGKVYSNERQTLTADDISAGVTFLNNDGKATGKTYPLSVVGTTSGTYYKTYTDPSVYINNGILYSGGSPALNSKKVLYTGKETVQAITEVTISDGVINFSVSEIKKNLGYQGYQGYQGYRGYQGYQGETGSGISLKASESLCTEMGDAYIDTVDGITYIHVLISLTPRTFQTNKIASVQGYQGYAGAQGSMGAAGAQGTAGTPGTAGAQGASGTNGADGTDGASAYLAVKYTSTASPSSYSSMSDTPGEGLQYIAICATNTIGDIYTPGKYKYSEYKGKNGTNGTSWVATDASFRISGSSIQYCTNYSSATQSWTNFNGAISVTPDLGDYVTKSTQQTISASKEFLQTVSCASTGVSLSAAGQINATNGFYETSDERLKRFDGSVMIDFENLRRIPKKYFIWKSDKDMKLNIGTSAQKVYEYYPELVSTDNKGYMSVAYDKLSIIALAAIDELHHEIEVLQSKVEKLSK